MRGRPHRDAEAGERDKPRDLRRPLNAPANRPVPPTMTLCTSQVINSPTDGSGRRFPRTSCAARPRSRRRGGVRPPVITSAGGVQWLETMVTRPRWLAVPDASDHVRRPVNGQVESSGNVADPAIVPVKGRLVPPVSAPAAVTANAANAASSTAAPSSLFIGYLLSAVSVRPGALLTLYERRYSGRKGEVPPWISTLWGRSARAPRTARSSWRLAPQLSALGSAADLALTSRSRTTGSSTSSGATRLRPSSHHLLQVYVSRLRALLDEPPDGRPHRARRGAGMRCGVAPGWLDVERSWRPSHGAGSSRTVDPEAADEILAHAGCGLWRGAPLRLISRTPRPRCASTPVYLEREHLGGAGDLVRRATPARQASRGRPPALRAGRAAPVRRGPTAELMLALYRGGRQAEALGGPRAPTAAARELGIEPPRVRELYRDILLQARRLALEPPEPPGNLPTRRRRS